MSSRRSREPTRRSPTEAGGALHLSSREPPAATRTGFCRLEAIRLSTRPRPSCLPWIRDAPGHLVVSVLPTRTASAASGEGAPGLRGPPRRRGSSARHRVDVRVVSSEQAPRASFRGSPAQRVEPEVVHRVAVRDPVASRRRARTTLRASPAASGHELSDAVVGSNTRVELKY